MGVAHHISKCRRQRVQKKKKQVFGGTENQPEFQQHIVALGQAFNHCFPNLIEGRKKTVGLKRVYKYKCIVAS